MGIFEDKGTMKLKGSNYEKFEHRSNLEYYKAILGENQFKILSNILDAIKNKDDALACIYAELDAASNGDDAATSFVRNSGIPPQNFENAMDKFSDSVASDILTMASMSIYKNFKSQDMMRDFKLNILDLLMHYFYIGKYEICKKIKLSDFVDKKHHTKEGKFVDIMNDLSTFKSDDKMLKMAYAYARRFAAAALYIQGVIKKNEFDYTQTIFQANQLSTGQTIEFQEQASAIGLDFIAEYDLRFGRKLATLFTVFALNDNFPFDIPQSGYYDYSELTDLLYENWIIKF
ncbi:hypothetical protein [Campylobacter fetus]|uniref:hypothetical protein n=1 Tax=Campylobacter fetus TaxID=196 RepID=UPI000FCBAFE0|nr:hypothetical protein [Campylobacter fetus]RUT49483.1 hypothetical protein BWK67_07990 [Campylobacter fetus]RUT49742.1 hypothetical protein BWK51_07970 [Campylobacter fetus]